MKYLKIIAISSILLLTGCLSEKSENVNGFSGSFNDQNYVWEQLQFPTNRVIDKK